MHLRIATRKSPLALWQSEHVAALLRASHPDLTVELLPMSTRGDEVLDRSLAAIGGKGLFLKELEQALLRGEADLAVHSLKDVPAQLDPEFVIGAILTREDSADAFVSNGYSGIEDLPEGARVGTSSLRRQAQLRALRPDLRLLDLRGNVNTRLAKLDAGDYEAIVLAVAGLKRLGFGARIAAALEPPQWLPAAAQGAICIESCAGAEAVLAAVRPLHDAATAHCVSAERALNRQLGGSCQVPIAALAQERDGGLYLQALVGDARSGTMVRAARSGSIDAALQLGIDTAEDLLALGAGALLQQAHGAHGGSV